MDRIVCENCGREYESILNACPECGHVHEEIGVDTQQPDPLGELSQQIFHIPLSELAGQEQAGEEAQPAEEAEVTDSAEESEEDNGAEAVNSWEEEEPEDEPEFTMTTHSRVREERYRIPTWALGALCGVLGIAIIAGVIFIFSSLTGTTSKNKNQQSASGQLTDLTLQDSAETNPDAETEQAGTEAPLTVSSETSDVQQPEPEPEPEPEELTCQSLTMAKTDVTLTHTGESFDCGLTVLPVALGEEVTWATSNDTLLQVDETGLVTALGGVKGECATVTASCQDKTVSCIVRFGFDDDPTVLTLDYSDVTLQRHGETLAIHLKSTLTEEEAGQVVWTSDNVSAAAVDADGVVTAISAGTAYITAALGNRTGTCIVRVK